MDERVARMVRAVNRAPDFSARRAAAREVLYRLLYPGGAPKVTWYGSERAGRWIVVGHMDQNRGIGR